MSVKRVAVVTGAGTGIGRASALALQRNGWSVVAAGRRMDELNKTVAQAASGGGKIVAVPTDVRDSQSVRALFARVREVFGRLDVLFNNAGCGTPPTPLEDLTVEQIRAVIDTNLTGSFLCAQEAIRIMKSQAPRGGRIINNGSIASVTPRPLTAPYTATKHAITGLTKSIALDGRPHDITASQIDVGNADTDMGGKVKEPVPQANGAMAAEPVMEVEYVAQAVLHIANLPLHVNILNMTVMATKMPFVGRG